MSGVDVNAQSVKVLKPIAEKKKEKKERRRMAASVLKQDPNT